MTAETDDRATERGLASRLREAVGVQTVAMVLVGVVAGYSLSVLDAETVVLPAVGPVPGLLVGGVGLAVAVLGYRKMGCCGDCGSRTFGLSGGCGCDGDCEDSCSIDP